MRSTDPALPIPSPSRGPGGGEAVGDGAVLVLGGRSEIGVAVARRLVEARNARVVLAARRPEVLDGEESALRAAGATSVSRVAFDADDLAGHLPLLKSVIAGHGPIATAVVAFGVLGDQARAERDAGHALAIVHTDFVAQVSVLTHLAGLLVAGGGSGGGGQIVAFSSIAGARVRRANYVYGAAKAGLDGFATGLAASLTGTGVSLLVVRPGFVVGRMTAGMRRAPLPVTSEQVAAATVEALARGHHTV